MRIGYFLSCEEFGPADLLDQARRAEQAGYDELYVGDIGPHWPGFFDLYAKEVLPRLRG
jgi:hypothetical protein